MPLKSASSTVAQRDALVRLRCELNAALDSLPGRYWATKSQREAYAEVFAHLRKWIEWEA